jgi:tetratricopeptide (TPR) repeat protein
MGVAVESDERSDPQRAAEHYRRSLELEPEQPQCLARYGSLLLTLGKRDEGLECLRRAVDLGRRSRRGRQAGSRVAAGRTGGRRPRVLREAMFRNSRDARFRRLWNDFQFGLAQAQEAARGVEEDAGPWCCR